MPTKNEKDCALAVMAAATMFESTRATASYLEARSSRSHETKRARTSTTGVFSALSQLSQVFSWRRRGVGLKWLERRCRCRSLLELKVLKQKRQVWGEQRGAGGGEGRHMAAGGRRS